MTQKRSLIRYEKKLNDKVNFLEIKRPRAVKLGAFRLQKDRRSLMNGSHHGDDRVAATGISATVGEPILEPSHLMTNV